MINSPEDIKHGLANIEIGEPVVLATIGQNNFSPRALSLFFKDLRDGHRDVLCDYSASLANVIGGQEHNELDKFGNFGQFAGRLSVKESGFTVIENELHSASSPDLRASLRESLTSAVQTLRAS
jgi:hypothetical protein